MKSDVPMRPLNPQERRWNAVGATMIFVFTTIAGVALAFQLPPSSWKNDPSTPFRALFTLMVFAGGYYVCWRGFTAKEVPRDLNEPEAPE